MDLLGNILETMMIVCFGISWPINLAKAIRSRTAKAPGPAPNPLFS